MDADRGDQGASTPVERAAWATAAVGSAVLFWMGWARFEAFHNETFDLAFYARMAWGLAVFDFWDPLQNAHVLGLHVSPVLVPLGWLGRLLGTVPVLLAAQAAAVGGAAVALGKLGARHLGPAGSLVGVAAFLAYPNVSHVVTYEWHPGTLAVLPLAWALERLDARDSRGVLLACLGVLACREDLALVTALFGVAILGFEPRTSPGHRRGLRLVVGSLAYLGLFAFGLHPRYAPAQGSFALHFGHLGDGAGDAVGNVLTNPSLLFAHVGPAKLTWLPRVLLPLGLLPLAAPRLSLFAVPVLGIAFFSAFPTTSNLDSHYLTTALPPLVASALIGAARVGRWLPPRAGALGPALLVAADLAGGLLAGRSPFDPVFRPDAISAQRRTARDAIPDGAAVQAPPSLLPHLAERRRLHLGWRADKGAKFVVLDLWHRERYAGREVLLRTSEEPTMRDWLSRSDLGLIGRSGSLVVLERGADPREGIARDYLIPAASRPSTPLTECLSLEGATRLDDDHVSIVLTAHGPCPADLALRVNGRVELPFDGLLNPAHLRAGDRLRSVHRAAGDSLRVGALRSSGARPNPGDPEGIEVPMGQSTSDP